MNHLHDQANASTLQLAQFQVLLIWWAAIAFISGFVYIGAAMLWSISMLIPLAVICLIAGVLFLTSRELMRRNRFGAAITLFVGVTIVSTTIVALAIPVLYPSSTMALITCFMVILPTIPTRWHQRLLGVVLIAGIGIGLGGAFVRWFEPIAAPFDGWLRLVGVIAGLMMLVLAISQYHRRLAATLQQLQTSNSELTEAKLSLEDRVNERTAALQTALTDVQTRAAQQAILHQEIAQQREAIRELSVPVLPVRHDTLVMPLIGALDTLRLAQIQEQALTSIERSRVRTLLLDITGVPVVDTQVAQGILRVVESAHLLGTRVALVGIRPEVAQTIVGLGLDLSRIRTYSDLQGALR